jgi:uncharacterized protein Smg (DUF494 family)
MENKEKVKVVSMTTGRVGVHSPELHFSRQWMKKGSSVMIDREILEELMYDNGFKYMIDTGMLYIEDMEVKKDLGLEPEDAEKPVNIIILTEKDMRYYMVGMPFADFKEKVPALSYEQIQSLADYAIANRLGDIDKTDLIKKICGKDIIRAIQLNDLDKED